jgi:ribonuclease T2
VARRAISLAAAFTAGLLGLASAGAQTPGKFDFYVLSLSWSPSYCEAEGARADRVQCGMRRAGFVVHGLWPQYERGFPQSCQTREAQPTFTEVNRMLDIFPSSALARHEWRQHGTCSGMSARNYFDLVRGAAGRVAVPRDIPARRDGGVAPAAVERAFMAANPGMPATGVAVVCDGALVSEVRICLTRELGFRPCPEVDARACRRPQARMPRP